jgi:hypothetical protein
VGVLTSKPRQTRVKAVYRAWCGDGFVIQGRWREDAGMVWGKAQAGVVDDLSESDADEK